MLKGLKICNVKWEITHLIDEVKTNKSLYEKFSTSQRLEIMNTWRLGSTVLVATFVECFLLLDLCNTSQTQVERRNTVTNQIVFILLILICRSVWISYRLKKVLSIATRT